MSDDRDKLLRIMDSLESDYKSGKISAEKYSYFRSKYEDKLNTIDARAATRRIRSMQGKSSSKNTDLRKKKPVKNKKNEEQDLVQKYIINPKKDDARYNKKERFSMDSSTFKLFLLLILVIGFTAGVAYGIFGCDFNEVVETNNGVVVLDTAFPDITEVTVKNTTTTSTYSSSNSDNSYSSSSSDDSDSSYSTSSQSYSSSDYSDSSSSQSGSYESQSSQSSSYDSGPTADSNPSASYTEGSGDY